jgi:hypothetical protein
VTGSKELDACRANTASDESASKVGCGGSRNANLPSRLDLLIVEMLG